MAMVSPGPGFWMIDFGRTQVIVPSTVALLDGSMLPLVVNMRAVPLGTLVTPQVKLGLPLPVGAPWPSDTIPTKKSFDGPPVASLGGVISGPVLITPKRI